MKGLVIKDFIMLKTMMRTYIIFILLYGTMGAVNNIGPMLLCIIPFMAMSTLGSLDEKSNFYRFVKTMPIKPKNIVLSRYFTIASLQLIFLAISLILAAGFSLLGRDFITQASSCLSGAAVSAVIIPVLYPLQLKFGVEKARLWVFIIFAIGGLLLGGITILATLQQLTFVFALIPFAIILLIILWVVSFKQAEKIVNNKEF